MFTSLHLCMLCMMYPIASYLNSTETPSLRLSNSYTDWCHIKLLKLVCATCSRMSFVYNLQYQSQRHFDVFVSPSKQLSEQLRKSASGKTKCKTFKLYCLLLLCSLSCTYCISCLLLFYSFADELMVDWFIRNTWETDIFLHVSYLPSDTLNFFQHKTFFLMESRCLPQLKILSWMKINPFWLRVFTYNVCAIGSRKMSFFSYALKSNNEVIKGITHVIQCGNPYKYSKKYTKTSSKIFFLRFLKSF